jgi:hypothetical protein
MVYRCLEKIGREREEAGSRVREGWAGGRRRHGDHRPWLRLHIGYKLILTLLSITTIIILSLLSRERQRGVGRRRRPATMVAYCCIEMISISCIAREGARHWKSPAETDFGSYGGQNRFLRDLASGFRCGILGHRKSHFGSSRTNPASKSRKKTLEIMGSSFLAQHPCHFGSYLTDGKHLFKFLFCPS